MKLSRSTYYYQVKRLTQGDKNKELKEAIQDIYSENKGDMVTVEFTSNLKIEAIKLTIRKFNV